MCFQFNELSVWCKEEKIDENEFFYLGLRNNYTEAGEMIAVKALHNLNANLDIPVGIEHFDEEETLSAKVNLDMSANNIQTLSLLLKNKTGNNILMPFNILTWVLNEM